MPSTDNPGIDAAPGGPWQRDASRFALIVLGCAVLAYASVRWSPLPGRPMLDAAGGLALAAVLAWGDRQGWAVALGVALGRWLWATGEFPGTALPLALGEAAHGASTALQALLGAWLLRRQPEPVLALSEPRELWRFFFAAAAWPALLGAGLATAFHVLLAGMPMAEAPAAGASHWLGAVFGVMVVAPTALAWLGTRGTDLAPRRWSLLLTGLISTTLIHLGIAGIVDANSRRSQTEFERSVQHGTALLDAELQSVSHALQAKQLLIAASDDVTADEFHLAATVWLDKPGAMAAVGWVDCPSGASLQARYLEARSGPQQLASAGALRQPAVAAAALAALHSGRPTARAALSLDPANTDRAVVLWQPVIGAPATGAHCASTSGGLVFAVVRLRLLWAPLGDVLPKSMTACLDDLGDGTPEGTPADRQLAGLPGCDGHAAPRLAEALTVADRSWNLVAFNTGGGPGQALDIVSLLGAAGMGGATLLMALLLVIGGRARRIEQAVAEAARRSAEGANRAKNAFLSRMSHELRTPLNAVLGFAQLLETASQPDLPATQKRWATQIRQAGDHLLAMINEILDLSRIESDTMALSIKSLSVEAALGEALSLVEQRAQQRGVQLQVERAPDADWLRGDATRVRQILANLLSNAVKYNRHGGRVDVRARRAGEQIEIAVHDDGIGMSEAQLAQLFQPFNRLGRESTGVEGTGIGLVISRRLAALMGGELRVTSTVEQGSTFTLALPVGKPLAPPPPDAPPLPTSLPSSQPSSPPGAGGRVQRVHYVEDNAVNLDIVRAALATLDGVELQATARGDQALAALLSPQSPAPDLILLDLHLPDVDGLVLLRRLKAEPATRAIPVVVVSADALAVRIEQAMAAGASEFLTKPLDIAQLRRVLRRHGLGAPAGQR
ncbi:MAG: ATP-binding protein [Burkholderiaceae bacterium]